MSVQPAQEQGRPEPFAATVALYQALLQLESAADFFARELSRLQLWIREHPFTELEYFAPPRDSCDEESRKLIQARRDAVLQPIIIGEHAVPPHQAAWYSKFDAYHRWERAFRRDLDNARIAAIEAARELDPSSASLLERVSTKIREHVQTLGGTVPPPWQCGDFPPADPSIPDALRSATAPIGGWIDKLRAAVYPRPPASASSGQPSPEIRQAQAENRFLKKGGVWELQFAGKDVLLNHRRGMAYLCYLLKHAGRDVPVEELESGGGVARAMPAAEHTLVDQDALSNYQKRLDEIAEEKERASEDEDDAALVRLESEREGIIEHLKSSRALGGITRQIAGEAELRRTRVAGALREALKGIQEVHPALYEHLKAQIPKPAGRAPRYDSAGAITWETACS
jgi:hypothetical protein